MAHGDCGRSGKDDERNDNSPVAKPHLRLVLPAAGTFSAGARIFFTSDAIYIKRKPAMPGSDQRTLAALG